MTLLPIANRVIFLLAAIASFYNFAASTNLRGIERLIDICQTQGSIIALTLAVLLIKSILDTMIGRSFPPREGY